MEKFGVKTSRQKRASNSKDKATCPSCKRPMPQNTTNQICPHCGSKPFEVRK